jgi:glucose/arabinose dehydrogenase
MKLFVQIFALVLVVLVSLVVASRFPTGARGSSPLTATGSSSGVFTDYRGEVPGKVHKITLGDLPKPYATTAADNPPRLVSRPADAWPQAPAGFKVDLFAEGLDNPRLIRTAPNGDLFLAESAPGRILVFHGMRSDGKPEKIETFAQGFRRPFGIAFYPPGPNPQYIYIANTDSVVRIPYRNGDLEARGTAETVIPSLPSGKETVGGGGHWTRDIAFSLDGKDMFVSVGSRTNLADTDKDKSEFRRADILVANPDGSNLRVYASGLRNPVGIAIDPEGQLWTSVNERDNIGDNLPPDYITHVEENGFYGWPWYYIGGNADPRLEGKHPELKAQVIVPDVLIEPHDASLELTFYESRQFPSEYHGDIFAAEHGSWNRTVRTGYEVIVVPVRDGRATGEYEDFLTGFVTSEGRVWGRPVGVAVAEDGSLLVSDDGSESLWRVSYAKK